MTLYIILIFSAICVGMAISVKAFGTGGKRKRIFQDIYFSIEEVDGIGVLYTKTGEYSAVLKMENPVQKYSANIEAYYEFTHLFAALAQTLGEGYALHKQDVFVRKAFKEENGGNHEFLSESYFRYFNGRPFTDSVCYLTITQENKKSRLMSFDNKKWRDFLVKIRKVHDQLRDAGVKSRFLGKTEACEYVDRFFSMNFRDKVVSMTNFKVDDETIGMGDRSCKVYSLVDVDYANLPSVIRPYANIEVNNTSMPVDLVSIVDSVPGADCVVFNQMVFVPNQKRELALLDKKKNRHASMPNPSNLMAVEDIKRVQEVIARESKQLVYTHYNLVNVRQDGTGVAHYDTEKDVIYLPRQRDFEHYNDYVQEMMRQLVSATGHQQRLAREGMVMKNGKAPSEDAVKKERLITEIASGVKMLELGLPARLSKDSLSMVDYWTRELKEDPCLIDAIESEVNGALKVLKKAELGEKVEYATDQHQRETAQIQVQLPNHYFVADEIKQHPNEEQRTVVIVRDDASKTADVVLPQGASLEVNNEIKGMNKQRFTNALQKEGYDNVRFYNPDGALGFRPDDSYFADKKITVSRLRNWSIEDLSSLDASEAVTHSRDIGFDNVQLVKDDKERWALYIKPEGKEGFAVYPDKGDLNHFFTTLKQSMDNIERVREELAQKYYAMAEAKPDLKVDIFGGNEQEVDLNRIQRVAVFRAKSGECLCAATIDGKKLQPRSVSPSQWQRLWVAPDRDSYKQNLAASLFADVLQKDNNVEQSTQEKQEEATEVKQAETAIVDKHDEQKEVVLKEDKSSEQREEKKQEEKKEEKKDEKAVKAAVSPLVQQYLDLKKKHPDAILLFRCGDFYETYKDDAVKASKILGITLTKSNGRKDDEGKPLAMAGFPYHALDTYLPKLIRAGERVAICDQLEMPKQTTSSKRGITEMVSPGKETGKQMAQESQETEQHTSLRR